ncbi:BON domain-containing protein [Rhodohalobacter sp. 8-1]|uniref:BON domain-containing protein n=1 Tax=Rhodohalobacter sp. 8-1 TaxID=3131972 RepID=UPI0030ED4B00
MPTSRINPTATAEIETRRSTRADALIREDIENQLRADTRVSNYDVNVIVDDGVVTLTGDVTSYRAKNAASGNAWTVPGVVHVINNLSVRYEPVEEIVPSDVDIAANIESSLSWDPDVDAADVNVTVDKGSVTLEGTVDSLWKKQMAEDKSWSQTGVVDVKNKLAVTPTEDISDEAAARNIVESIDRNRNVDIGNIDVEVTNGVATLTGSVFDVDAWRFAYDAAFYTSGIKSIEDNLSIETATEELEPETGATTSTIPESETETRTDALIREDVENELISDSRVSSYDISVAVNDGVVTLTGEVPSRRAKNAASDNAWNVPGVMDVVNSLSIRHKTAEATVPSDLDITSNVENSLSWDPDVDESEINVSVENGVVSLEGTVDSLWKKHIAEEIAWNHLGVVDVISKLAVASPEDITDQAVAQNIIDSIDRNVNVDVNDVDVEVHDGEAVLNGVVSNMRAWRAAYDAALYTSGVIRVKDNLSIV